MAIPLIYSFRSIAIRKGSSAMAVGGIALVVIVFVTLLALAEGFQRAAYDAGVAGYFTNPLDLDRMHQLIAMLLSPTGSGNLTSQS